MADLGYAFAVESHAEIIYQLVSDTFKQIRISGAEHSFRGYDDQVVQTAIEWLKEQEGKAMR